MSSIDQINAINIKNHMNIKLAFKLAKYTERWIILL